MRILCNGKLQTAKSSIQNGNTLFVVTAKLSKYGIAHHYRIIPCVRTSEINRYSNSNNVFLFFGPELRLLGSTVTAIKMIGS